MNETLCRALIQARLTEEDVAARLEVDPKTVRRWLEGRVPYLRYRWAIAAMLGVDETDLWPQLRTSQTRPDEVIAIYPHLDAVPQAVWLSLFGSAEHEIGILHDIDFPRAADPSITNVLAERAESGVKMRICLSGTMTLADDRTAASLDCGCLMAIKIHDRFVTCEHLRSKGEVEICVYGGIVYNSIYYADDQLLVSQRAYGVPSRSATVLHLRRAEAGDIASAYFDAFERTWAAASSAN